MSNPVKLLKTTLANQTVDLGLSQWVDFIQDATLTDCRVNIHSTARSVCISRSTFTRCHIHAKKPLCGIQWTDSCFENCEFRGTFKGAGFGYRPYNVDDIRGRLVGCDFSQAKLIDVGFYSCSLDELRLPPWPHFALAHPQTALRGVPKPSSNLHLSVWLDVALDARPELTALVFHAPEFAKKAGLEVAELERLIAHLPGLLR